MRAQLLKKEAARTHRKRGGKEKDKDKEENPSIYVKTVVISHPDIDHYGWLRYLFCEKKDHIDYLILGGLPEHYDTSGKKNLLNGLKTVYLMARESISRPFSLSLFSLWEIFVRDLRIVIKGD